jgi:hypothetical protein
MSKKKLTPNQEILVAFNEFGKAISIDGTNLSETQWANLIFYASSVTKDSVHAWCLFFYWQDRLAHPF